MNEVEVNFKTVLFYGNNFSSMREMAIQGFLNRGRGAVVIDDHTLDDKRYWHYFNLEMLLKQPFDNLHEFHTIVKTYAPLSEFAFLYVCKLGTRYGTVGFS